MKLGSAPLRKWARRRLPSGYTFHPTNGGHAILHGPDGKPLRLPDGKPFKVACSPSNPDDLIDRMERTLRRMGVLS